MAESVRYIDLDEIKPAVEVVVKLGGKEHRMVPLTVDGFIDNFRLIEGQKTGIREQMDVIKQILTRAFPTLTPDILGKLTLEQLQQLRDQVASVNGQKATEDEIAAEVSAEENPPTAG